MDGNKLRWLASGWSVIQMGGGDPAWYLDPHVVDIPKAGKPEESEVYASRPYSY
jgi:hypothetical protein